MVRRQHLSVCYIGMVSGKGQPLAPFPTYIHTYHACENKNEYGGAGGREGEVCDNKHPIYIGVIASNKLLILHLIAWRGGLPPSTRYNTTAVFIIVFGFYLALYYSFFFIYSLP